jgi:taurine transport system permease protein
MGGRQEPEQLSTAAVHGLARRVVGDVRWLGLLSVACVVFAWFLVTGFAIVPRVLLPGPAEVFATFVDILRNGYRDTSLLQNAWSTLRRCAAGFLLACLIGIPLGLIMGYWRSAKAALNYIVEFMRPLPPLSYLVLLILWLGTGDASKIALLFLAAFPIIVSSSMAGVWATKPQRIQVARSLGAGDWSIFRHVVFPSALPMVLTGTRIALAGAFSTVVAAELMAATNGLGWMIFSASRNLRNDIIIIGIITLGLLGMALGWLMLALDRRLVHWRGLD